ncbi:MAG: ATP-binding cassette domain-containing protein [Gemmatimonadetes bacterium]|nr:ATP-binding cassette domain-containing protein [Gemmatimonadota bacterium]MCY3611547.1 ATP-binding cassette domain-containing protein [Gemmatimonadota bacterium]
MIETLQLTRYFDRKAAVQELDMRVEPGEILGFPGPNGAGKTTTVKILTCMIRPSEGSARVAGFDVVQDPMEVKRRLGYVRVPIASVAPCLTPPAADPHHAAGITVTVVFPAGNGRQSNTSSKDGRDGERDGQMVQ